MTKASLFYNILTMKTVSNGIVNWEIGDRVKITKRTIKNIVNGNRSIKAYPCDSYVVQAIKLEAEGVEGTITHRFPPGYEATVSFDNGLALHIKDNYVDLI